MRALLLSVLLLAAPLGRAGELLWQTQDDGQLRTWEEATRYCAELGPETGWRLPLAEELQQAFAAGLAIGAQHSYWSGSSGLDTRQNPDIVRMLHEYGMEAGFEQKYAWRSNPTEHTSAAKTERYLVRCVRE
jgi:formylglycine-generating enzyme required for sulfatase activity